MINEKSSIAKPVLIFVILLAVIIIIALSAIVYLTMFKKSSPATVQPTATPTENLITNVDISDWNIYKNEKFGYELKYPQTINCEQELGIGIDPADNYICSLKKQNNLFISIKPQIIESSQDRISFYRSAKMGSIDAVDIQNKDILATISNYMESIDFIALNKSNFVALNDTNNLIGFSKTESYNSNTPTPAIWYDESWFFIHDNALFAVYISYDGLQQNSNAELSQISDLKSIITTLTFYKPSGTNAKPQYNTNIADWKTYRNEEYGYEIKYPRDWYLYSSNPSDIFIQPDKENVGSIPGPHANAFEIKIKTVETNYDLVQEVKPGFDQAGISFTKEPINIGNIQGLKIASVCDGVGCGAPQWIIVKGNTLYHFDSNLGYNKTFDYILYAFKFIR